MMRCLFLMLLAMTSIAVGSAQAGESCFPLSWRELFCPGRTKLPLCCPDDYCRKKAPCHPDPYCPCGVDDYCSKPFPCLSKEYCPKGCDDYEKKSMPPSGCELPWFRCHPTDNASPPPKGYWLHSRWWCPERLCPSTRKH